MDNNLPRIVSVDNERIKLMVKLGDAKERDIHGLFVAHGLRTCMTLVQSGTVLEQLYLTGKAYDQFYEFVGHIKQITLVSDRVMKKMHITTSPSGIVGLFKIPSTQSCQDLSSSLVLDGISDPGNMGTLIRAAVAMNRKKIVLIGGVDPWNLKVVQASVGYIGNVVFVRCDWPTLLKAKASERIRLLALVAAGGKKPDQVEFKNSVLVIGNEAHGIDPEWIKLCDEFVTLPMPGNTESLNAAIAGAIALYVAYGASY